MSTATVTAPPLELVEILRLIHIAAPIEIAFASLLEEMGPDAQMEDGTPMPFQLEAWPGGRWFRDLGNQTGHLWGHVQVIKPPKLLEICGPMMMSYPAQNHVQYRLTAAGNETDLAFAHRGIGLITPQHREGMPVGWQNWLNRVRQRAERQA